MCGIAGFVGQGSMGDLEAMTARLVHRGPDGVGVFSRESDGLHLGHRRLSIVDPAGGAQPMSLADGSLTVIFNGEIYNAPELRRDLEEAGNRFFTDHSDTEVLLHGYRQWGLDGLVGRLNGMWAFAIDDRPAGRLVLSRDRFGKKPLYWFFRNGTLAFASELTSLLCHPLAPRSVSPTARSKFFAYALIPSPHSIVDGIWKLPGGHHLIQRRGESPEIRKYWEFGIEPEEPAGTVDGVAEELRALLEAAVRRRLVADVPVGVFLSGGIDSTAVAALAAGITGRDRLRTYSVGFEEKSFDESAYAHSAASVLGTRHLCEVLSMERARDLVPDLLASLDEPQGDNSVLPTWLLSGFTRRHVTVALGGDGGDELFAGYDTFRGLGMADRYDRWMPRPLHPAIRKLIDSLPTSHANISLDFKLKRGMRGASYPRPFWNPIWLGALEPAEIERYTGTPMGIEDLFSEAIAAWDSCQSPHLIDRTLEFYTKIYLQDGILTKVDRASMLHGLEARTPFLDIHLVNFARKLPHTWKLRHGQTKWILKRALRGIIPDTVIDRKKKGFGSPVGGWFASGQLEPLSHTPFVRDALSTHRAGHGDQRLFLWCQLSLDYWEQHLLPATKGN